MLFASILNLSVMFGNYLQQTTSAGDIFRFIFFLVYGLTLGHLGNFYAFLSSADLFQNQFFFKTSFRNTIRVSNKLDPDQARHFVGPDLGPNCLQKSSADDTWR